MTMAERLTSIQSATGVLAAELTKPATPINSFPTLSLADVTYWIIDGDLVTSNAVEMIVVDQGEATEAAYWTRRIPPILRPAEIPETYITDRTTAFSAAQIEGFANTVWVDANPLASDILEFSVNAIDGRTVRISGKFDVGASSRESRNYYIWLVDANGSVTPGNSNVKFERITEETVV